MNWAFVDYENVRSLEAVNLTAYQRVFIFCGPQNKSIKIDDLPPAGISRIELISVPTSSKNNVDFHLAFHLGVEHGNAGDGISFHVISNDKGYQGLINHLEMLGRSCKLVEPNATKKSAVKKAPARKTSSKTTPDKKPAAATGVAAGKSGASSKNTTASKATGRSRPAAKIKTKAASAAALSDAASKLFAQLQVTSSNRPKTKTRVLSWLKSHVKSLHMSPEPSPEQILDEWKAAGMLSLVGSTVSYPDA